MKKHLFSSFLLFLSGGFLSGSFAHASAVINFTSRGITDDVIANSIRPPAPPSVTKLLTVLSQEEEKDKLEELRLGGNNISLQGAKSILDFIDENFTSLKYLDLSYNQLRDRRGSKEYEDFEESLVKVLTHYPELKINLGGNVLYSLSWIQHINAKLKRNATSASRLLGDTDQDFPVRGY